MKKIKGKQIESVAGDQVLMTSDLKITKAVGEVTIPNGSTYATISMYDGDRVKSVQEVIEEIFSKDNEPTVTNPSVTDNMPAPVYKEAGSTWNYSVTPTLNPGSYQYGPETGVVAKSNGATLAIGSKSTSGAAGTNLTMSLSADSDCNATTGKVVSATLTISYNASTAVPKTQLGNTSTKTAKIAEGQATRTKQAYVSYLKVFYGTSNAEKDADITSSIIRGLQSTTSPLSSYKDKVLTIEAKAEGHCYILAIPSGASYTGFSAEDTLTKLDYQTTNSFVKKEMTIQDAGGNNHSYDVWIYRNDANVTGNTFNITIK